MQNRLIKLLPIITTTILVDLGLIMVFVDSAFRGYMPAIQYTSFVLIVFFPIIILVTLLNQHHTGLIASSLVIATLIIVYFLSFYKQRMVTDKDLILITIGFCLTTLLLVKQWKNYRHQRQIG